MVVQFKELVFDLASSHVREPIILIVTVQYEYIHVVELVQIQRLAGSVVSVVIRVNAAMVLRIC